MILVKDSDDLLTSLSFIAYRLNVLLSPGVGHCLFNIFHVNDPFCRLATKSYFPRKDYLIN